jgi:molybdenum cofactor guanylyltransferase
MDMRRSAVPKSNHNPQSAIRDPFSAVLLAGGRSTRMGRDKASVEFEGEPLWRRQLATLRATGASELLISGRSDGPFAESGVPIIGDITPDAGPLAALEAVLPRITTAFVVALAIDLPAMRADFLAQMVAVAQAENRSVVPESAGLFEPLAAVYAPDVLPLVVAHLRGGDRSMQHFLRAAAKAGLLVARPLRGEDRALFHNLNSPEDIAG